MSYNNNYGNRGSNYGGGNGYDNRVANYSRGGRSSGSKKKHSGAKRGNYTSGGVTKPWVNGWRYSRSQGGLTKYFATPYKGTHEVTSQTGKKWEAWICQVTPPNGAPYVVPCLYCSTTGKVIVQKLTIVLNPQAANGGYAGTFIKR